MSLFQCENCGCCENTAMSSQGFSFVEVYDWRTIPHLKGKKLCSSCGPTKLNNGKPSGGGKWHGEFKRVRLPRGEFKTNREGNLQHIRAGSTNFLDFELFKEGKIDE